jgi:hypothetical protein
MRPIAEPQSAFDPRSATSIEFVDLGKQDGRIHHHSLPHHAPGVLAQNTARQETHDDLFIAYDEGMTGIGTTSVPNDHFGRLGIDVDDFPLPLVAPLGAYDDHGRHFCSLLRHSSATRWPGIGCDFDINASKRDTKFEMLAIR